MLIFIQRDLEDTPLLREIKVIYRRIVEIIFVLAVRLMRRNCLEWESRAWSNRELRKIGSLFSGDILNLSGWKDEDKEGGYYRDYFVNKRTYTVSNKGGARGELLSDHIVIDLESKLVDKLKRRFDVVFNHTTMEHIFDIDTAMKNFCWLTRDIVILVVPFMQVEHWENKSYYDYWRFTEFCLNDLLKKNGFEILYLSNNINPVYPIYFFVVASRCSKNWEGLFDPTYRKNNLLEAHYKARPLGGNMPIMM